MAPSFTEQNPGVNNLLLHGFESLAWDTYTQGTQDLRPPLICDDGNSAEPQNELGVENRRNRHWHISFCIPSPKPQWQFSAYFPRSPRDYPDHQEKFTHSFKFWHYDLGEK